MVATPYTYTSVYVFVSVYADLHLDMCLSAVCSIAVGCESFNHWMSMSMVLTMNKFCLNLPNCRCYEVQCVSGPVIGNYSGNSAVNLSLAIANPPYQQQFTNLTSRSQYPLDDKGAIFEGNSGQEQDLLTVQCQERAVNVSAVLIFACKSWDIMACDQNMTACLRVYCFDVRETAALPSRSVMLMFSGKPLDA